MKMTKTRTEFMEAVIERLFDEGVISKRQPKNKDGRWLYLNEQEWEMRFVFHDSGHRSFIAVEPSGMAVRNQCLHVDLSNPFELVDLLTPEKFFEYCELVAKQIKFNMEFLKMEREVKPQHDSSTIVCKRETNNSKKHDKSRSHGNNVQELGRICRSERREPKISRLRV